jgi:predicted acylesterase/phospholipase RssA
MQGGPTQFTAESHCAVESWKNLCSDLRSYKIADAVAASAAVPLAFAPIVLETFSGGCSARLPGWICGEGAHSRTPPT